MDGQLQGPERVKVWDIGVRVGHWSLAVLFFIAYASGDEDSLVHVYAGYGVAGIVGLRLLWGLIGTEHARFTDFIYGPRAVARYAKSLLALHPPHYLGHNPLGGWMVAALLLSLAGVSWSGLEVYGAEGHGPLALAPAHVVPPALADGDQRAHAGAGGEPGEGFWEEIHEALADITLTLAVFHIAGVVLGSALHQENLIRAMVTGYKRTGDGDDL